MRMINWEMAVVFATVFFAVTLLSLRATYWHVGESRRLAEWGVAGRRFGMLSGWFLLGGTIVTGNAMISIPGLIFAKGAQGFYTIPYTTLIYPLLFVILTRFWIVARRRGYITAADFVSERFGRSVGLLVALTGILATMPYLAVQIYGMEVILAQMGLPIEASLVVAFLLLSLTTYIGGLRVPAFTSIFKDIMLIAVILIAGIVIPMKLGGLQHIFTVVHQKAIQKPNGFSITLQPSQYVAYGTQVLGGTLSLFLYPHTITASLSVNSYKVLKRSAIFLLCFTFFNGIVALFGFFAIAAGITASPIYQTNIVVPALFARFFPAWFAGFALSILFITFLVPAVVMSIGVASLFSRNIYRECLNPSCNEQEELKIAQAASFFVKCGALVFILIVPTTFVNNLQLMGSVWILQTFPAVFLGLYTRWFHRWALILGWIGGMAIGTWIIIEEGFISFYPFKFGSFTISVYAGLAALMVNLLLTAALTPVFKTFGSIQKQDVIPATDFVRSAS